MLSSMPLGSPVRSKFMPSESFDDETPGDCGQDLEMVRSALAKSPYRELQQVVVGVSGRIIRLDGQTTSFFMKQMAQEIVRANAHDAEVENGISVKYPKRRSTLVDADPEADANP